MKATSVLLLIFALVLFDSASAFAQCGATADGDLDPNNPCRLCNGTEFENLPARTACDGDGSFTCDSSGVYRRECEELPGDLVECNDVKRADACPNGLTCQAGTCLLTCSSNADCQTGWMCGSTGTCERIPNADMGPGPDDMGTSQDMGESDMGRERDMEVIFPDTGSEDVGPILDMDTPRPGGKSDPDDGGCAQVSGDASIVALLFVLVIGIGRKRAF